MNIIFIMWDNTNNTTTTTRVCAKRIDDDTELLEIESFTII